MDISCDKIVHFKQITNKIGFENIFVYLRRDHCEDNSAAIVKLLENMIAGKNGDVKK